VSCVVGECHRFTLPIVPSTSQSGVSLDMTRMNRIVHGCFRTMTVRYGAVRHNVLSLPVVLADASVVRTGGRARKSSAGDVLTQLFVGAEGTLGVITEAVLRVHPTPEVMAAAVGSFPSVGHAVECIVQTIQMDRDDRPHRSDRRPHGGRELPRDPRERAGGRRRGRARQATE
jgi:FAD/FMN-containing dehydrogenase